MITGNKTLSGNKVLITQSGTLPVAIALLNNRNMERTAGSLEFRGAQWTCTSRTSALESMEIEIRMETSPGAMISSGNTGQIRFFHALCGQGRQVKQPSQLVRSAFWKAPGARVR